METDNFVDDLDRYIEQLKKCELILETHVKQICEKAKEILINEENVIYLNTPITVNMP
jgi:serine/threonine-protein phosphatase 4 catalytic subunit